MPNTIPVKDPDAMTQASGKNVAFVYLIDPSTQLAYKASGGGGGGSTSDVVASGNLTSASGAGSTVQLQLGTGQATWEAQLTGTFSSGTTIAFQGSDDASSPTNWQSAVGYNSALTNPSPITQISGPGPFTIRGASAGYQFIQVICTALHSGDSVAVRLIGSTGALAGGGPVSVPDGADVTQGSKSDAAVTNPAVSATAIALLKGLLTVLEGTLIASVSGTVTANIDATNSAHLGNIDTATSDLVTDLDSLITNTTGLATQATLASAKTDLDTIAGIVSSNKAAVKSASGDIADGAIVTLGTEADAAWGLSGNATVIAALKELALLLQHVAYDNTNELKTSLYGKNAAAGDTPLGLDVSGRITSLLQVVGGTALVADQSNTELRVSNYIKTSTAGDTPLTTGQENMANSLPVAIASNQSNVPFNLAQVLGATLAPANPNITEDNIHNWVRTGNGFIYANPSSVTATNNALTVCGLSIFNPSSAKNILIFSIQIACNSGAAVGGQLRLVTTDPSGGTGFTGVPTSANLKTGGGTTIASLSSSASGITASPSAPGNLIGIHGMIGSGPNELLTNGATILLPSGVANGLVVMIYVNTAGNSFQCVAKGIEY